ncbi:hypothetical protein [Rhodopseudomonas palustris]|uniref:hypothetical protein n=1 Tax=Rhodopseudomonas palustris TaxID=1076 RepID=UPI0005A1ED9A
MLVLRTRKKAEAYEQQQHLLQGLRHRGVPLLPPLAGMRTNATLESFSTRIMILKRFMTS